MRNIRQQNALPGHKVRGSEPVWPGVQNVRSEEGGPGLDMSSAFREALIPQRNEEIVCVSSVCSIVGTVHDALHDVRLRLVRVGCVRVGSPSGATMQVNTWRVHAPSANGTQLGLEVFATVQFTCTDHAMHAHRLPRHPICAVCLGVCGCFGQLLRKSDHATQ